MMSCHEANEVLVDAVFGEPEDRAEARLNEHLRACSGCRMEEAALLRLQRDLQNDAVPVDTDLEARLRAAVRAESERGLGPAAARSPASAAAPIARRGPDGPGVRGARRPAAFRWLGQPVPIAVAVAGALFAALLARVLPDIRPEPSAIRPVPITVGDAPDLVPARADETAPWELAASMRSADPPRASPDSL